jgi:hypothetical protein
MPLTEVYGGGRTAFRTVLEAVLGLPIEANLLGILVTVLDLAASLSKAAAERCDGTARLAKRFTAEVCVLDPCPSLECPRQDSNLRHPL